MKSLHRTLVVVLALFGGDLWASDGSFVWTSQTNGLWRAWLEATAAPGTLQNVAISYAQKLYVQGPSNDSPRLLLTQSSTGLIKFWLGSDGVLVTQPIGRTPEVFFPGKESPILLEAPRVTNTNYYGAPQNQPFLNFDHCWFSGRALLYESRMHGGADYIIGLFMIDSEKQNVSTGRICLELTDTNNALVRSAAVYGDRILFVGTHVFWQNVGYDNDFVKGTWRSPQVRAFDLETKQISSGAEIPAELLAKHNEELEKVFGTEIAKTIRRQQQVPTKANIPVR